MHREVVANDAWVRDGGGDVPLAADVVELLDAHAASFAARDAAVGQPPADAPLIRAIEVSVPQWARAADGTLVKAAAVEEGGAALTAAGIYAAVKRFFARASKTAAAAGLDAARFEKASTHWMRHTFVRQA